MGLFQSIARVFSKKEEHDSEKIEFEALEKWTMQRISASKEHVESQLEVFREKADSLKKSSLECIETLKNAQLRNENIPEKAKHFMEGNRETYIKWTIQFLDKFDIPESADRIEAFISDFNSEINGFAKHTIRPFKILSEFFEEEAGAVASAIKSADNIFSELKEAYESSLLKGFESAIECIKEADREIAKKRQIADEKKKVESRKRIFEDEKRTAESEHSRIMRSREYSDFISLSKKLESASRASSEKEAEINSLFSQLDRPMRKYQRISYNDSELIGKYLESPAVALASDFGMRIITAMHNLKNAIKDNTIELKDKQKLKAFDDIGKIDRENLSRLMSEYAHAKKEEAGIKSEIERNSSGKKLESAKEKMKIADSKLSKADSDIEALAKKECSIDIEELKKKAEESINKITGIKVSVI